MHESTKDAPKSNRLYSFGPFQLDACERRLVREGIAVPLVRKVFDLLLVLLQTPERLQTREELIETLWPESDIEEHNLTAKVCTLRKALGDEEDTPKYIETVRGVGYRFIAPVAITEMSSPEPVPSEKIPVQPPTMPRHRRMPIGITALLVLVLALGGALAWRLLPRTPAANTSRRERISIAVLPFENLSADPTNAYFAAGIQDTILTRLTGIGEFRVISRTSSTQYPSHPHDLKKVASALGAGVVLEGSVQKSGQRALVNVQLINVHTGAHLWAHSYDRTLDDVFAVEGDVATKVATALEAKLDPDETARLDRAPTRDAQAYLLYLKANYYANQVAEEDNVPNPAVVTTKATALYRQALAHDPQFALAWARLSLFDSHVYWFGVDFTPARIADAERTAQRAIALAPGLAQARMALGYVRYYGHRDYRGALAQFERVRRSLPNDTRALGAIAYVQRRLGNQQQALEALQHAASLDPRNPVWPDNAGLTLTILRRYGEADRAYDRALAIAPRDYNALTQKAGTYLLAGSPARAAAVLARIPPGYDSQGFVSGTRYETALLARRADVALAALRNDTAWMPGVYRSGGLPESLMRAWAWDLKGDRKRARLAYTDARAKLLEIIKRNSAPSYWSALGMAEAGLGNKAAAIKAGREAMRLLPLSNDALDGAVCLATMAKIYARLGDAADATKILRRLLTIPAGHIVSVSVLELDPIWDSIRHQPAFQALLTKYRAPATTRISPTAAEPLPASASD